MPSLHETAKSGASNFSSEVAKSKIQTRLIAAKFPLQVCSDMSCADRLKTQQSKTCQNIQYGRLLMMRIIMVRNLRSHFTKMFPLEKDFCKNNDEKDRLVL